MNRLEALLAPPTLSSKDMAMHVKMQKAVPREQANSLRAEMLVPEVRLYDELTTLRFRRPGPEEESAAYTAACAALSSASGKPIPYRFFKGEFEQLLSDLGVPQTQWGSPDAVRQKNLKQAVMNLSDPWRVQAYAALCARIAEASETEDPDHAPEAWDLAFRLYQKFFSSAKVEDSTTYQQQTEEKFRQDTVTAWNGFRQKLVDGIAARTRQYIKDRKPESVTACAEALNMRSLRDVDADAADRVLGESLVPYVNAIGSSSSLAEAGTLYDSIPQAMLKQDSRKECLRAMIVAMKKETDRLTENDKDKSVKDIISWIGQLDTASLYASGTPLVKKAAADFYEACGAYARDVINKDRHTRARYADSLMSLLPDDIVIANGPEGPLHREDLMGVCFKAMIRDKYLDRMENLSSEREARELGQIVYDLLKKHPMPGSRKNELLRQITQNTCALVSNVSEMSPKYKLAFFECFPDDMPIVDKDLKTIGGYKILLKGVGSFGGSVPDDMRGIQALAEFAQAEDGDSQKFRALQQVTAWALEHPNDDVNGTRYIELADACCQNAFIGALNQKDEVSDYTFRTQYKPVMEHAASFLPSNHEFPAGSQKLPMNLLVTALDLNIDQSLRRNAEKARKGKVKPQKSSTFGKPSKPPAQVKPPKPPKPYHPGVPFGKVLKSVFRHVLPPLILALILYFVMFRNKTPATGWRYIMMLLQISIVFQIPIGLSIGYLKNDTPHEKFWSFVLIESYLLCAAATFYQSLVFFHALPMKVWAIIIFIIFGIIWLLLTIGLLASKK